MSLYKLLCSWIKFSCQSERDF